MTASGGFGLTADRYYDMTGCKFGTSCQADSDSGPRPLLAVACPDGQGPPRGSNSFGHAARMEKADAVFHSVLTDVYNRSAWEDTFVDALSEPPETYL